MLELTDIALLMAIGAIGGFLSGMLGVGGGVIFVPAIDYLLQRAGIKDQQLVNLILANSLATIMFTGTVGSIKQFRIGNFFPRQVIYTAIPGVLSSLILSYIVSNSTFYSKDRFNIFFVTMLTFLLIRMFIKTKKSSSIETTPQKAKTNKYMGTGLFTGIVTALSGLGGGIVMVPVFTNFLHLNIKTATSISTGVITILVLPLTLYYGFTQSATNFPLQTGHLIFSIILPLAFGSFFMTSLGVKTAQKISPARIRIIFVLFVSAVLIRMLIQLAGK